MQKIKLLFITITHSGGGGAEKVLTTLVNNLPSEMYDISIQEMYGFGVKKEPINDNIKLLPPLIKENEEKSTQKLFKRYIIDNYPEIIRSIRLSSNYDIVISWNYQCPSFLLPSFSDVTTIGWFHGTIYDLAPSHNLKNEIYNRKLQQKAWDRALKLITISKKSLQSLEEAFPEYIEKSQIIYNPIEIEKIKKLSSSEVDTSFLDGSPVLVCIGRLDKNKNFSLVLEAVSLLKDKGIKTQVLIIGEGYEKDNLKAKTRKLNIENNVLFLGYKQNPYPFLHLAKLLCVSSFEEGFPMVVTESLCLGVPFVTTPVAGASDELIFDGECGLVAKWDAKDYSEKIETIIINEALHKKMSKACSENIKKFSIEQTILNFNKLVAQSIDSSRINANTCTPKKNLSFDEANKKLKVLYICSFDFALQRLRFAFDRLYKKRNPRDVLVVGFHIMRFLFYILTIPVRWLFYKNVFKLRISYIHDYINTL